MYENNGTVLLDKKGHVATICLNRPEKLNAMTIEMSLQLESIVKEVNRDHEIRVVVLKGAGERAFCTGSDIKQQDRYRTPWEYRVRESDYTRSVRMIRKPVIVMIHGYALGGGLEMAVMGGDILYATADAKLGAPEVNWGWLGAGGNSQYLPRTIGPYRALELMLTGEFIDAAYGEKIGLINRTFPTYEAMERHTYQTAEKIAEKAPLTTQVIKKAVWMSMNTTLDAGLEYENELVYVTYTTEDKMEGERAFKEKRKPVFKGR